MEIIFDSINLLKQEKRMLFRYLKLVVTKCRNISFQASTSFFTVLSSFLLLYLLSCNNGIEPNDIPLLPLSDDVALFVSMDGTEAGLWILNANSLELIDSMITTPGVPWNIEFSLGYSNWYSCWGRSADYSIYSCNLQPLIILNSAKLHFAKYALIKSYDEKYLIAYGYKGIDIFERTTLTLVKSNSSLGEYSRIAVSKKANKFYFTYRPTNSPTFGFGVYDLDLMKITDVIEVFDKIKYSGLQDVDLIVSPNDNFLYFSAWNWLGGGGFNSFFVIDISQKKIVDEFSCGPFAQLAISLDGTSVYLSNPSGYLYGFQSHHKMLRYDVSTNTMNNFLNIGGTDRIVVADDNRTIFVSIINGGGVIKVDAYTGKVIGSFSIPPDSLGHITNSPRNIKLGRYFTNNLRLKKGGKDFMTK
ncbi:MAG: hypothetical protein EPN88_17315 [Bacteroidetes bacterium]|nr:MAG: hypothetical protein EPN88_17315 [Bacteroidota bacterium]